MSESCLKRHFLIMMTLTPTKSIEPYQVLFERSPILQLIVRLEKKNKDTLTLFINFTVKL